jgi:transposase
MGVAYSQDLRDRVMAAADGGLGVYSAAPMFRVSVSYLCKALGRRRAPGDVTAHKSGGGPKPKLAAYDEALRAQVAQRADVKLIERQAWLANDHAVKAVARTPPRRSRRSPRQLRLRPPNRLARGPRQRTRHEPRPRFPRCPTSPRWLQQARALRKASRGSYLRSPRCSALFWRLRAPRS